MGRKHASPGQYEGIARIAHPALGYLTTVRPPKRRDDGSPSHAVQGEAEEALLFDD